VARIHVYVILIVIDYIYQRWKRMYYQYNFRHVSLEIEDRDSNIIKEELWLNVIKDVE